MKTKKVEKKLYLKRSTITNLDKVEMNDVHGGGTCFGCPTHPETQCADEHMQWVSLCICPK